MFRPIDPNLYGVPTTVSPPEADAGARRNRQASWSVSLWNSWSSQCKPLGKLNVDWMIGVAMHFANDLERILDFYGVFWMGKIWAIHGWRRTIKYVGICGHPNWALPTSTSGIQAWPNYRGCRKKVLYNNCLWVYHGLSMFIISLFYTWVWPNIMGSASSQCLHSSSQSIWHNHTQPLMKVGPRLTGRRVSSVTRGHPASMVVSKVSCLSYSSLKAVSVACRCKTISS
jgi:hypothetical protein